MSSILVILPKRVKEYTQFFATVEPYIIGQGLILVDNNPKIYFSEKQISPNSMRGIITALKNNINYTKVVKSIYFSTNLTKA